MASISHDATPTLATQHHPCDIYQELRVLYDTCNAAFFNNVLPACMILLRGRRNALGYFQPACWGRFHVDTHSSIDAIALNTATFCSRSEAQIISTLVHEMTHLWQEHYGEKKPANGNHNLEWGRRMMDMGLMPSRTGQPGGKKTGKYMSHFILENGQFARTYAELSASGTPLISWHEVPKLEPVKQQEKKYKHYCPQCELKAWTFLGNNVMCGDCREPLITDAEQLVLPGGDVVNTKTGEV